MTVVHEPQVAAPDPETLDRLEQVEAEQRRIRDALVSRADPLQQPPFPTDEQLYEWQMAGVRARAEQAAKDAQRARIEFELDRPRREAIERKIDALEAQRESARAMVRQLGEDITALQRTI